MPADQPKGPELPPELERIFRDPSIVVPQDAAVWNLIGQWANAPSNTPSASLDPVAVATELHRLRSLATELAEALDKLAAEVERGVPDDGSGGYASHGSIHAHAKAARAKAAGLLEGE